ncbi:hypothetical protein AK812_SmicGene19338 [Symbiodinium microadriaticum]|uniref:Uncharacterized protein n=1 Tax=Symbiodinium microadriaticum TaxID=2951 RepID=A0A1Q9DSP5_SYMMI|nr:hypothetical protein AK812_SmicGene19338 [Symbiodinium microadriaticum]
MDEFEVSDDAMALSNKLYAVLTTMLRERPLQLLRSVPNNNGFEAWRVLHTTLAPTSKTRALALLGAISQYPNMSQGNLLEQLLKMEDLFEKYEQAVKPALLLRVLPQSVKSHLTVSITDESTCDQMREVILRWERSSQKWCSQIVTGSVQFKNQPSDDGGLAPMDVDRVKASGAIKDNVRYISESPTSAATPSTTSVPSTASSVAPSVKRVFNLEADSSDDARDAPLTTIFEMASESSEVQSVAESEWWCRVVQHFEVHRDDDLAVIDCSLEGYACHDLTMFDAYEADYDWGYGSENTSGPVVRMMDAQGGLMANLGSRRVTMDLGQACVQEVFHASDVDVPLLSLGRLLKKGWSLEHRSNMLHLCNDGEGVEILVSFKL